MSDTVIIKLGGSLLSPYDKATEQVKKGQIPFDFSYALKLIKTLKSSNKRFIIVVGGGFLNRWYLQNIRESGLVNDYSLLKPAENKRYHKVSGSHPSINDLHTIGIASSIINASMFKMLIEHIDDSKNAVYPEVIKFSQYEELKNIKEDLKKHKYIIASGWKPGHSHDVDALIFAMLFNEKTVLSLKNIDGVYNKDPKRFKDAKKIPNMTWKEYIDLIKVSEHNPGASFPVDAKAARAFQAEKKVCVVLDGSDIYEVSRFLKTGDARKGTKIL